MEKVNQIDLSIIILAYKSQADLQVLLPSIFASRTKYSYEVIIVDNDSGDGTAEFVRNEIERLRIAYCGLAEKSEIRNPQMQLIENVNNGFAAGNNIGIRKSSGRYILLLNPDTKVQSDTFEVMLDMMENRPDVGMAGCKLIKGDGKLDLACRRRFPNPTNSFKRLFLKDNRDYNYSDADENQELEVDSVVGAFLLIRRPVIDKIGLLDESFFMYGEDLDWCWRCKEAGFKVLYFPRTFIYHYKGQSSKKAPQKMLRAFHDTMWIFYRKHYAANHNPFFKLFIKAGIYGRYAVLSTVNFFKSKPVVSK